MTEKSKDAPRMIIRAKNNVIELNPGPVYCFYSKEKFSSPKSLTPSFREWLFKIRKSQMKQLILLGKPLVDPYFLNWNYKLKVNREKTFKRFEDRSVSSTGEKNLLRLKIRQDKKIKKLIAYRDRTSFDDKLDSLESSYQRKAPEDLLKGERAPADSFERKIAALVNEKSELDIEFKIRDAALQSEKDKSQKDYESLKRENERRFELQKKINAPWLAPFDEEESQNLYGLRTADVKRISAAKNKEIKTRFSWKTYDYFMLPALKRLVYLANRHLLRSLRRTFKWFRAVPSIDLISHMDRHTKAAVNNFKIGILGQDKQSKLVSPRKTVGENLVKMLMITESLSSSDAYARAVELLSELDIYDPAEIMGCYLGQFINDDYHYKLLLAYLLAFKPEVIVVDRQVLKLKHNLTNELYSLIVKLQPKYGFIFCIYDDTLFDKDFKNMKVFEIDKSGNISTE